jgi:CDP-glucose 4,6-dehydratase
MAFNNFYQDKKVLITGHTGFKGGWLSKWLIDLGATVAGLSDEIPTNPSFFEILDLKSQMAHHLCDVRNRQEVEKVVLDFEPDIVFHLAAQAIVSTSYKDPASTFETNVMGTVNVLNALKTYNKNCVAIFITSDKCYDNVEWPWGYRETDALGGKDIYSGSKGAAELAIKSYFHSFLTNSPIKIASARAGNVIGGGDWALDRIVPDSVRAWKDGKSVCIRSPKATRPWQHVLEPLSGYLSLAQNLHHNSKINGQSYNFGPSFNENITVETLLSDLVSKWHEKIQDPVTVEDEVPFHEAKLLKLNCDKSLMELKWQSTLGYLDTIELVGSWYSNFYSNASSINDFTSEQISYFFKKAAKKNLEWTK